MDLFAYIDTQSISPVLAQYALPASERLPGFKRFLILQEIIAGHARLTNLEGHARELMERINLLQIRDILEELEKAQDAYEEAVSGPWFGFGALAAAIILHYAIVIALARQAGVAMAQGPEVTEPLLWRLVKRWWEQDYKYLRKWRDAAETDGDSPEKRANRATLYSGNIRGVLFRYIEILNQAKYGTGNPGWVAHYQARGDKNTCKPCQAAVGWYLLGHGPFPGQVCKGRSRCRCVRVIVYDPARLKLLIEKPDFSNWDYSTGVV